jgi:hypothetical protein
MMSHVPIPGVNYGPIGGGPLSTEANQYSAVIPV